MLDIESPFPLVENMATSFRELEPMNRFFEETCGVKVVIPDMQTHSTLSSLGAVKGSVGEVGSFDDGPVLADKI